MIIVAMQTPVKKIALACATVWLFLMIGSASAQDPGKPDPIIGTWKLNPAATKVSPGMPFPPPPQRTEVYRQTDSGQIALAVTTPGSNGSVTTVNVTFNARGGVATQDNAPSGQMLTAFDELKGQSGSVLFGA